MGMGSAAQNGRKKRKRLILFGGGIVILLSAIFGAKAALSPNRTMDPAKLAAVERGDIARSVVATGKIEPLTKVELKSKASGIVKELRADVGDRVKAGQVLVELDKEQLQAAVREGQANLQASKAAVESAQAASQRDIKDAEGTDVPFLKTGMDRAHELYHDGLIPRSSVEDAEKAYKMAINKQQVSQANVTVSQADVLKAKAQVAQAEASLEQAQQNLEYSTIASPMDGIVLSRDVVVGDAVSSILVLGSQATLLMTLGDTSQVYVEGKVDEADVGKVYVGQTARIVVESFKDKKFNGKVTRISPMGEEKDNVTSFAVRVSIDNPGGELRANMSANAEIILDEKHGVVLVPESAVLYDKDKNTSVEIPDPKGENGKRKIPVKLGITNGVKAQILAGLQEGQKVVLQ
jgi:HlyD family secretion protein